MAPLSKLARKNLILDPEAVRLLAEKRGTSQSEAVRQAVEQALGYEQMADEFMDAIEKLRAIGGIEDVFGHLDPDPDDDPASEVDLDSELDQSSADDRWVPSAAP